MRCASPSTIALFPTPGSPIKTGLFFLRRHKISITRWISDSRPTTASNLPSAAARVKSVVKWSMNGVLLASLLFCNTLVVCAWLLPPLSSANSSSASLGTSRLSVGTLSFSFSALIKVSTSTYSILFFSNISLAPLSEWSCKIAKIKCCTSTISACKTRASNTAKRRILLACWSNTISESTCVASVSPVFTCDSSARFTDDSSIFKRSKSTWSKLSSSLSMPKTKCSGSTDGL